MSSLVSRHVGDARPLSVRAGESVESGEAENCGLVPASLKNSQGPQMTSESNFPFKK